MLNDATIVTTEKDITVVRDNHRLIVTPFDDGSTEYNLRRVDATLGKWVNLLWFRLASNGQCLVRFQL